MQDHNHMVRVLVEGNPLLWRDCEDDCKNLKNEVFPQKDHWILIVSFFFLIY